MADDKASDAHVEAVPPVSANQKTTRYSVIFAFSVGLFGWLANFDQAFGGIVILMTSFQRSFGHCSVTPGADGLTTETCSLSALKQSLIQLTLLFMAMGAGISGFVGNYVGRRGTLQLACLIIAISAGGMIGSAGSFLNFMVCKCIGGVGIGMIYSAAPTWGSESVAAQKRGLLMSLYNVGLASGNVIMAAVCAGTASIATNWAWQAPIMCQIPASIFLCGLASLYPESPRWLLMKALSEQSGGGGPSWLRKDYERKARESFARLNETTADSPLVDTLVSEVKQHIELERSLSRTTSWTDMFRGIDLKRTHVACLVLIGNAITGVQFVIPYTALFLASVGLKNPYALNVAISSCVLAGTIPGPFLCEYVGRRLTLIGGYIAMGICMLIFAVVATALGQAAQSAQVVLIAFLCLWALIFGATSGPTVWVASPEMHSLRLRTFGQGYAVLVYEVFSFGAAFWTPYMLGADYGDMGTNVGYFYFGVTAAIIALTALFVPETGRLTLEQVDGHFASGTPAWRTSLGRNKRQSHY
ncbi:general substrate transporter [Xylariaceae sp. FL0804]|nr:general substrate transporter [Xylariaceae sp. FL0804]